MNKLKELHYFVIIVQLFLLQRILFFMKKAST